MTFIVCHAPRSGTGTVSATKLSDPVVTTTGGRLHGIWSAGTNIYANWSSGNTGRVYRSAIGDSLSWTQISSTTGGNTQLQTGNATHLWQTESGRIQRRQADSGDNNSQQTLYTPTPNIQGSFNIIGFVWWNDSLWYVGSDGVLWRWDNVDQDASQWTETNVGTISVDGTSDPGDMYKLFGGP